MKFFNFKFIAVLIILVLAGGGFGYYYLYLRTPKPAVTLEVVKPDRVLLGEPFAVTVSYANDSADVLKDAKLSVVIPEGLSVVGGILDQRVVEEAMGDLGPGSLSQKTFTLIATRDSQSLKRLEIKLRYGLSSSPRAQFENTTDVDIPVGPPAVDLSFTAPQNVFSGERFDTEIKYRNDGAQEFRDVRIRLTHPSLFEFKETSVEPVRGEDNVWDVGTLMEGDEGTILISGSMVGEEESFFNFDVEVTAEFLGQTYTLNTQSATIGITKAPLSLSINIDGSSEYVARVGAHFEYRLVYRNNSNVALQDLIAEAALVGELYDFSTIQTKGSFNSLTNTLQWSRANLPELGSLLPGEERTISFRVSLKDAFPIRRLSDKNYTLKVRAEVRSPTIPETVSAERTIAVAQLETRVEGLIGVDARAFFYDAPSGILNEGPYPPRVNQPTQYTIHWKLTNYATDVRNVHVSTFLQSGARFTGQVKSNMPTEPVWNAATGEVTWDIPRLVATRGIVGDPPEAIFQIEVTPAINQSGRDVTFAGETIVEAQDEFTGRILRDQSPALTTALPHDTVITTSDRRVRE